MGSGSAATAFSSALQHLGAWSGSFIVLMSRMTRPQNTSLQVMDPDNGSDRSQVCETQTFGTSLSQQQALTESDQAWQLLHQQSAFEQ